MLNVGREKMPGWRRGVQELGEKKLGKAGDRAVGAASTDAISLR